MILQLKKMQSDRQTQQMTDDFDFNEKDGFAWTETLNVNAGIRNASFTVGM